MTMTYSCIPYTKFVVLFYTLRYLRYIRVTIIKIQLLNEIIKLEIKVRPDNNIILFYYRNKKCGQFQTFWFLN